MTNSFLYPHKPEPDAPSSQNDKPVNTAKEAHDAHKRTGQKPKGWPGKN